MDKFLFKQIVFVLVVQLFASISGQTAENIRIAAAAPIVQKGSNGSESKAAALEGRVLGQGFGSSTGDFAEYEFTVTETIVPALIKVRYARANRGKGYFKVLLDGEALGVYGYSYTGGGGEKENQFAWLVIPVKNITTGLHRLRLQVIDITVPPPKVIQVPGKSAILDLVGNRKDKNTVGHGKNIALYTGYGSKFFYATHDLTDIFDAVDGETVMWYPDHVVVGATTSKGVPKVNLDQIVIEQDSGQVSHTESESANLTEGLTEYREVCVTENDVTVSRIVISNSSPKSITRQIVVQGDCRRSADWRNHPGNEKITRQVGDYLLMLDKNVFPEYLPDGLAISVGSKLKPAQVLDSPPGTYHVVYDVEVPAGATRAIVVACAVGKSQDDAIKNLQEVLGWDNPIETNRHSWEDFYTKQVPQFNSSDPALNELYAFRWFLLKISLCGGDLGYFKYPVDLEGRQAYQTYCCYSAPFMALDLNWAIDPQVGFGEIANMGVVAYEDGRFPWYASPRSNRVHVDHQSRTGESALPMAAWRFYQIHNDKSLLDRIYPFMKKNMEWWISDRDPDGNGLFSIDNQLETGMDDLHRRWQGGAPPRYEAIDASSYAFANLKAVANMAFALGRSDDGKYFNGYAEKTSRALAKILWDPQQMLFRDRNPDNGEFSDYQPITMFYPYFAGAVDGSCLDVFRKHLFNENEFWLPFPVPALSKADPEFNPAKRYWAGPTWPAANSHVVEALAAAARSYDRTLLPKAAELLHKVVALQMQPRADFYEHYDPNTGKPMSVFRDYMHSWWIDTFIRNVIGLIPQDDGSIVIDPLPMGLSYYSLKNAPYRGHLVDVFFNDKDAGKGLVVRVDGKALFRDESFVPGGKMTKIPLPSE